MGEIRTVEELAEDPHATWYQLQRALRSTLDQLASQAEELERVKSERDEIRDEWGQISHANYQIRAQLTKQAAVIEAAKAVSMARPNGPAELALRDALDSLTTTDTRERKYPAVKERPPNIYDIPAGYRGEAANAEEPKETSD